MIKRGIVIQTAVGNGMASIVGEIDYDDKLIDSMYYRDVNKPNEEGANLVFAAFVFPAENREQIQKLLDELNVSKKAHDDLVARVYYTEFPKYNGRNK